MAIYKFLVLFWGSTKFSCLNKAYGYASLSNDFMTTNVRATGLSVCHRRLLNRQVKHCLGLKFSWSSLYKNPAHVLHGRLNSSRGVAGGVGMCEVQIRAGVGCETGLFKPVKHIQILSLLLILQIMGHCLSWRCSSDLSRLMVGHWLRTVFLSFSEYLLLASFVSLFLAW